MRFKSWISVAVVAASMIASREVQAAPIVFTSHAAFLAAISAPGVDTFDDVSIVDPTPSALNRVAGSHTYVAATPNSFFGVGSAADVWLSTNTAEDTITFDSFSSNVQAFGAFLFGTDFFGNVDPGAIIDVTATDAEGTVVHQLTGTSASTFLGFVSSGPLTSVTVTSVQPTAGFVWPTVNDVTLGSEARPDPVTEPAALSLLGAGLLAAATVWRRRFRA